MTNRKNHSKLLILVLTIILLAIVFIPLWFIYIVPASNNSKQEEQSSNDAYIYSHDNDTDFANDTLTLTETNPWQNTYNFSINKINLKTNKKEKTYDNNITILFPAEIGHKVVNNGQFTIEHIENNYDDKQVFYTLIDGDKTIDGSFRFFYHSYIYPTYEYKIATGSTTTINYKEQNNNDVYTFPIKIEKYCDDAFFPSSIIEDNLVCNFPSPIGSVNVVNGLATIPRQDPTQTININSSYTISYIEDGNVIWTSPSYSFRYANYNTNNGAYSYTLETIAENYSEWIGWYERIIYRFIDSNGNIDYHEMESISNWSVRYRLQKKHVNTNTIVGYITDGITINLPIAQYTTTEVTANNSLWGQITIPKQNVDYLATTYTITYDNFYKTCVFNYVYYETKVALGTATQQFVFDSINDFNDFETQFDNIVSPTVTINGQVVYKSDIISFNFPKNNQLPDGTYIHELGDNFLRSCPNLTEFRPWDNADAANAFDAEHMLITIGDNFLRDCTSFNDDINLSGVFNIGDNFMRGCTNFDQPVNTNASQLIIGDYFMSDCTSFNTGWNGNRLEMVWAGGVTIGDYFLNNCTNFNALFSMQQMDKIGSYFMNNCINFNQDVDINGTLGWTPTNNCITIPSYFMNNCRSFNSRLRVLPFDGYVIVDYSANPRITCSDVRIEDHFLNNCISFNSNQMFEVQNGTKTKVISIGEDFMKNCTSFNADLYLNQLTITSAPSGFLENVPVLSDPTKIHVPASFSY